MQTKIKPLINNILLAVDGSQHALAACHLLCDLTLPTDCTVHVVSVLIPRNAAEQYPILEAILSQTKDMLEEKGRSVSTNLLTGYPGDVLVDYAEQHALDLIVLGAKGLRGTLGILLGGVAQQIVEHVDTPVLVVRTPYNGLRRVLLTIDESLHSQLAIQYLAHFPLPAGAEIKVMHVLPPVYSTAHLPYAWPEALVGPFPSTRDEALLMQQAKYEEEEGKKLLGLAIDMLKSLNRKATSQLSQGDAATEIIEYAKNASMDLIVVGSRGLSRIRGLLLGSVSRKLVHYAGCSVLIVKSGTG
jgi:nucleotide-binding universal stress UspA family protein